MSIDVAWLGQQDYEEAWNRQKALVAHLGTFPEEDGRLLLLEHPPTYTLGRNGRLENLLLDEAGLRERGIAFHRVDRGGDITYHGPGQLVGYPVLNLRRVYATYGLGFVRRYVQDIEEVLVQTLAEYGLNGRRYEGHRGVWLDTAQGVTKIAAVGIRISAGGISSHGFALNVDPDLTYFSGIVPCGIREHGVTSMAAQLGRPVAVTELLPVVTAVFGRVFQIKTAILDTA
jgi:lipoyl(octanoyl) transferase